MKYKIFLLMTLTAQVVFGQSANSINNKQFAFVDSLLNKNQLKVEVIAFEFSQEIQEIMLRFNKAVADNKEWVQDYFSKNYKEGEGLPYNEKFGISKEEYQKIKDIEKTPPVVVIKKTTAVSVIRNSGNIEFTTSDEEVKIFEMLKVDLNNHIVFFNYDSIPFHNQINAPSTTPFGEWHGYSWKKENSNLGENDPLVLDKLVSKVIEIDFGIIKSNGKGLLRIKFNAVDTGKVIANVDMAYYIN